MACMCLANFPKSSTNLIFLRLLKQTYCEQKLVPRSTYEDRISNKNAPIKYTTNKASKMLIAETTGLNKKPSFKSRFAAYTTLGSLAIFLIYFCCLREENDIDEILKGNTPKDDDRLKLIQLKLQLNYCEKSGLPTASLKAKIDEMEEKNAIQKSPFKI